jgi:hypothetical protein
MSKIVIQNVVFPFDLGCRLLKLKGGDCPFDELSDFWNEIKPLTFKEIAMLENLEQRRIGVEHLGIDNIVSEVNPILLDKTTLKKTTTWINEFGVEETINFDDTYELYKVSNNVLLSQEPNRWGRETFSYYVKFKDTSTDREYLIWVNLRDVFNNNYEGWKSEEEMEKIVTAIDCIAWTITTNVEKGNIKRMLRQGDCVLIEPKEKEFLDKPRHITKEEYNTLLEVES